MIILYLKIVLLSHVQLLENIEKVLSLKLDSKNYLRIPKNQDTKIISVQIFVNDVRWKIQRTSIEENEKNELTKVKNKSDGGVFSVEKTVTNLLVNHLKLERFADETVYFNIFFNDPYEPFVISIYNKLIDEITLKYKNFIMIHNFPKLFVRIEHSVKWFSAYSIINNELSYKIVLESLNYFYCLTLPAGEINWNEYIISTLIESDWFKLSDTSFITNIFQDFDFVKYGYFYSNLDYLNFFYNIKIKKRKADGSLICIEEPFKKALKKILNVLKPYVIPKRIINDIMNFYKICKTLNSEEIHAISILYHSFSKETLAFVVNRLLDDCTNSYSLILIHILRELSLISESEKEFLLFKNLKIDSPLAQLDKIGFTNNLHYRQKIKDQLYSYFPYFKSREDIFLMILICQVFSKMYVAENFTDRKYTWNTRYSDILKKIGLEKTESNVLYIFTFLFKNFKMFTNLIGFERNLACMLLSKKTGFNYHISVNGTGILLLEGEIDQYLMHVGFDELPKKIEFSGYQ